jgi:class 3 adenylate cyclase
MSNGDDPGSPAAPLPVGTLTFVLTDIEGSTQLWDDDPAAMTTALQQHDALIAAAIDAHGGRLVKSKGEGDSTFSVFEDPSAAVSAAEAMRDTITAASWPTTTPIRVRIGVLTGVAELRDGDYYGASINRAARVRSIAHGGEILLAASTYALIADSLLRNRRIDDRGEHELRGLQRPERVYALRDGGHVPDVVPAPRASHARLIAIVAAGVLVLGGVGWFVASRDSGGRSSAAGSAPSTTTSAVARASNLPSVGISSVEFVNTPDLVRYEVSGISSRVEIPPYEIRVLARAPVGPERWLWSSPAKVDNLGQWTGELDVPTTTKGVLDRLKVSAIAILSEPSAVAVGGTTTTGGLPYTGPTPFEEQLMTRGPAAKGVIAVSEKRSAG